MSFALHKSDLTAWFASGCKPREQWRIGTEHEKIGFCTDSLRPIPYINPAMPERSIRNLLQSMASDGWQLVLEQDQPIALKSGLASVTLEPGGQLELSGAPLASIHETCLETNEHLTLLSLLTKDLGIGFLSMGFQPKWKREDIPWMPKKRYNIMREYMPKVGSKGLDMMLRTTTVQANLDFSSETDMARKMRIGSCLQPIVTALFAASPFKEGKPSGLLSTRADCWLDTDPSRTGIPACIFGDDFGFESYTEWLLDVPMYFVIRDGEYINCTGQSFRDFMAGKLPALPGETPTMNDWELHASTAFPEVRLKQFLEMRGADAGPQPWLCALPALWKGLLYDETALGQSWDMVTDWQHREVENLRQHVPTLGLNTAFRDTTVLTLAEQMFEIASGGLERIAELNSRNEDERIYLRPLIHAIEHKHTQAEYWLDAYHSSWHGNIDRAFFEAIHP